MGFFSSRSRQVGQSWSFRAEKYSFSALWYSPRHLGQPMELMFRVMFFSPSRSNKSFTRLMTSTSALGFWAPNISTPNWWNSLNRPFWVFSWRKQGVM